MAKTSLDLAAMTAAFLAKGGTIAQVETGKRAIESDRTIYAAMREGVKAVADADLYSRKAEARAEAQAEAFRAAKYDGWSSADAHAYAQEAEA